MSPPCERIVTPHELKLREFALEFPEAYEEFPWEHRAMKVKKKVFIFLGNNEEGGLSLSVKLPHGGREALLLPFATPTGYGLGKSGWVSASFGPGDKPPLPILCEWIDESYRAVATKTLVKQLDGEPTPVKTTTRRKKA
jgi:predicted DNA-binding protein (MmcQ/YjbR family)